MILFALVLATFLQASFLSVNLLLLVLIARSFITNDQKNFYLAFGFGLLLTLLIGKPLGSLSLLYLVLLTGVRFIKRTPLASRWLVILPLGFILLTASHLFENLVFKSSLSLQNLLIETAMILPIYFAVRFWEERFVPRQEIRLKIGK